MEKHTNFVSIKGATAVQAQFPSVVERSEVVHAQRSSQALCGAQRAGKRRENERMVFGMQNIVEESRNARYVARRPGILAK